MRKELVDYIAQTADRLKLENDTVRLAAGRRSLALCARVASVAAAHLMHAQVHLAAALMDRVAQLSGMDKVVDFIDAADEHAAGAVRSKCTQAHDKVLALAGGDVERTERLFCAVFKVTDSKLASKLSDGGLQTAKAILKRLNEGTLSEVAEEMVEEAMRMLLKIFDDKFKAALADMLTSGQVMAAGRVVRAHTRTHCDTQAHTRAHTRRHTRTTQRAHMARQAI